MENTDKDECILALTSYQQLLLNRDICEGDCARGQNCPTGCKFIVYDFIYNFLVSFPLCYLLVFIFFIFHFHFNYNDNFVHFYLFDFLFDLNQLLRFTAIIKHLDFIYFN